MTSKAQKTDWQTTKRLKRYGFDADPQNVRVHKSETLAHVACRRLCGYILQNAGHSWDEEVEVNEQGDRVDIIDFGTADELPLAIEFESTPTENTIDSKIERYVSEGPCRDMILFDLRECPETLEEIAEWISAQLAV